MAVAPQFEAESRAPEPEPVYCIKHWTSTVDKLKTMAPTLSVVGIYGEFTRGFKLDPNESVASTKRRIETEMIDVLSRLPGVPPNIRVDIDATDIYPSE